jgi:hypothetical protein
MAIKARAARLNFGNMVEDDGSRSAAFERWSENRINKQIQKENRKLAKGEECTTLFSGWNAIQNSPRPRVRERSYNSSAP